MPGKPSMLTCFIRTFATRLNVMELGFVDVLFEKDPLHLNDSVLESLLPRASLKPYQLFKLRVHEDDSRMISTSDLIFISKIHSLVNLNLRLTINPTSFQDDHVFEVFIHNLAKFCLSLKNLILQHFFYQAKAEMDESLVDSLQTLSHRLTLLNLNFFTMIPKNIICNIIDSSKIKELTLLGTIAYENAAEFKVNLPNCESIQLLERSAGSHPILTSLCAGSPNLKKLHIRILIVL